MLTVVVLFIFSLWLFIFPFVPVTQTKTFNTPSIQKSIFPAHSRETQVLLMTLINAHLYLVQSFYQNDYSPLCLPTSAWKTFVRNIISTLVLLQVVLFPLQLVQNATSRLLYRLAPHHNFSRSAFSFIYLFIFNQGVSVVSPKLWKYPSSRALFITGILKTSLFLLC